jgi:hypothetical protein
MNQDSQLIETIKAHFARKSSAQLQEIAKANDLERWSAEAITAAGEVLQDRKAGLIQEPEVAEDEPPPPPFSVPDDPYSLGFYALGLLSGLGGLAIFPVYRADYSEEVDPDLPVPFGPKIAWLALETTNTEAVATALELQEARTTNWADGVNAAYQGSVFVTPPLGDWTLAVGTALFPPDRADAFVKPLMERLSGQFGEAQYFCTHGEFELHVWARGQLGRLVRGYGWLGEQALTLWDEGMPTKEELELGFWIGGEQSPKVGQGQDENDEAPDEAGVMQLACLWSIDPTSLNEQYKESVTGLLGKVAWAESRTRR